MSELPKLHLRAGDFEIETTPEDGSLYRYLGKLACYDHIFVQTDITENGKTGNYIFLRNSVAEEDIYAITNFMLTRGFECHLNLHEVLECDEEAFSNMISQQIGDFDSFPEEWDAPSN